MCIVYLGVGVPVGVRECVRALRIVLSETKVSAYKYQKPTDLSTTSD